MHGGLHSKLLLAALLAALAACSSQSTGSSGPSGGGLPMPSGGGSAGPTSPGPTSPGGLGGGVPSGGSGSGSTAGEGESAAGGAAGGGSEGGGATIRDLGPDTATVASVDGCDDQDRVARQLCEAATEEDDPFLRAALCDEYNEYKKLVAR